MVANRNRVEAARHLPMVKTFDADLSCWRLRRLASDLKSSNRRKLIRGSLAGPRTFCPTIHRMQKAIGGKYEQYNHRADS